ncbi:MAG: VWA domain-containing protein, partial [Alphaproteobacteria bacterium]
MFYNFFSELREAKIPVTLKEYLVLLEGLDKNLADYNVNDFYYLSRTALVKDERNLDKFDQVFGHAFRGMEALDLTETAQIPEEWLKALTEKFLTDEEKKMIESLGGWEKIMETLKERLEEQKKRHEGGNKMIGTAGTSPFGAYGYNPEGVRIGQKEGRHGKAVKVWDKREYKNLDDSVELGTRNIKVALRRLRKFAREGVATELDLPDTIRS